MNKNLLRLAACCAWLCFGFSSHGQGTIRFNNLGPTDGKAFIVTGPGTSILLNQDLNFSLDVQTGAPPNQSRVVKRSWLLSDGTANGINVGPGLFADPSNSTILLPGIEAGTFVDVFVKIWAGNHGSWEEASGRDRTGSIYFTMAAGSISSPPESLVGMPPLYLGLGIPEPATWALLSTGMILLWAGRKMQTAQKR